MTRRDGAIVSLSFAEDRDGWYVEALTAQPTWVTDGYAVVPARPEDGGTLGASATRTLSHLGVPLSPPPTPAQ